MTHPAPKTNKTVEVRLRFFTNDLPEKEAMCWATGSAIVIADQERGIPSAARAFTSIGKDQGENLVNAVLYAMNKAGIRFAIRPNYLKPKEK